MYFLRSSLILIIGISLQELSCLAQEDGDSEAETGECNRGQVDKCLSQLMLFNFHTFFPFRTKIENKQCMEAIDAELCIRDYMERCLDGIPRFVMKMLVDGVNSTIQEQCLQQENAGFKGFSCIFDMMKKLTECKDNTGETTDVEVVEQENSEQQEVLKEGQPFSCCSGFSKISCFSDAMEESCGLNPSQFFHMMTRSFASKPCKDNSVDCQETMGFHMPNLKSFIDTFAKDVPSFFGDIGGFNFHGYKGNDFNQKITKDDI